MVNLLEYIKIFGIACGVTFLDLLAGLEKVKQAQIVILNRRKRTVEYVFVQAFRRFLYDDDWMRVMLDVVY